VFTVAACLLFPPNGISAQNTQWEAYMESGQQAGREGNDVEAERSFSQAVEEAEKVFGPESRQSAISLHALGRLYNKQGRYADAEPPLKRALSILEAPLGPEDRMIDEVARDLFSTLSAQEKRTEALELRRRHPHGFATANGGGNGTTKAPPSESGRMVPEIIWNLWLDKPLNGSEGPSPAFDPVPYLTADTSYLLALDLSAFSYKKDKQGIFSRPPDEPFTRQVAQWLEEDRAAITLQVYMIPDLDYFLEPTKSKESLTIKLDRIKKLRSKVGITLEGDPFIALKKDPDPPFVFGRVLFPITTGTHEGIASIGLSLWDMERGRPLDEISVRLCIASKATAPTVCKDTRQLGFGLKGTDSLRVASESSPFPDAALHFFALDPQGRVVGLFRQNDQSQEPIIWRLEKRASELYPYLGKTQLQVFNQASEEAFSQHGEELYNLLFPVKETKARAAFEAFVSGHVNDKEPASIFVRLVEPGASPPLLVPLGLVRVKGEFLGFHFRIEVPLQVQEYRPTTACVSRWVMVLPPKEGGVDEALAQARASVGTFIKWSTAADKVFDNKMSEFGTWLRARSEEETPATALVVLSHHFDNQLSFTTGDTITSESVAREFIRPSVVILNGCGTALPGTVEFIGKLNRNGFETVIATNTQVEGAMAGQFLDCLATALATNSEAADAKSISLAHFNALQCLKTRKSPGIGAKPYGARVLSYTLLGNGDIRLCPPK
jgi:hypothetical protein